MDIIISYLKKSRLIALLNIYMHWYKPLLGNNKNVLTEKIKNKIAYYLLVLDFANQSDTSKQAILEEFLVEPMESNNVMQYIEHYEFDTIDNIRFECGNLTDLKMSSAQNTLYFDRITRIVSNLIFSSIQNNSLDKSRSFTQVPSFFITMYDNEFVNRIDNSIAEVYNVNDIEQTKILHCVTKVIQYGKQASILKYLLWLHYYSIYIQNKNLNLISALPVNLLEFMPDAVVAALQKHVPVHYFQQHNFQIYETAKNSVILLTNATVPTQRFIFYVDNPSNFKFSTLHLPTEDVDDVSSDVQRLYVAVQFNDSESNSNLVDWSEINQVIEILFFIDHSLYAYPRKTLFCLNNYCHYDFHIDFSCMNAHRNMTIENWHTIYSPREVIVKILLPINPNILQLIIKRNMVERLPMALTLDLGDIESDGILMTDFYRIIAAVLIAYESNVCLFLQRQCGQINDTYEGKKIPILPFYKLSQNDNYKLLHLNKSFYDKNLNKLEDRVIRIEKIDNQLIIHCVQEINEFLNNVSITSSGDATTPMNEKQLEYNYLDEYIVSNPCDDNIVELLFSGPRLTVEKTEFRRESKYFMSFRDSVIFFEQPVMLVDELAVLNPYVDGFNKMTTFRSLEYIYDLFYDLPITISEKIIVCHEFSLLRLKIRLVCSNTIISKLNSKLFNNVYFWVLVTTDGSDNSYSIEAEHEAIISEYVIAEKMLNSGTSGLLEMLVQKRLLVK